MRSIKKRLITGEINCDINEAPPKVGNIIKINKIVPNLLKKLSTWYAYCFGSNPTSILPPSSGCIGTRLNIASDTFKTIKGTAINESNGLMRPIKEINKAIIKFDAGPANEISAESRRGFLRL